MSFTSFVAVAVRRSPREALMTALAKMPEPIPITPTIPRVVIKPSIYDPNLPRNTTFGMIKAVVDFLREVAPLSIVESDTHIRTAEDAFDKCGYNALKSDTVELVNLSKATLEPVKMAGHYLNEQAVPKILLDNKFIVNVATAKKQKLISFGAGIKNLFGLLPQSDKQTLHPHISDILLDLLLFFKPDLTIIDLTQLLLRNRSDMKPRQFIGVVVGTDPVAVDAYCAHITGLDPLGVEYLRKASDLGIGEALPERIQVFGTEHQKQILESIQKN